LAGNANVVVKMRLQKSRGSWRAGDGLVRDAAGSWAEESVQGNADPGEERAARERAGLP